MSEVVPRKVLFESVLVPGRSGWDSLRVPKSIRKRLVKKRKRTKLGKDKRRKHRHWQVTVFYKDGERFARVYTDRAKASRFAERQRKSPVVRTARVLQVG